MNNKFIILIRNFSYTLASNIISFIISAIVTLIVPKLLGLEEYGYWQLYLFYSSYVGFLHFGWLDGIYLRYGGAEYDKLDKKLFYSQFIMLLLFQFLISVAILVFTVLFVRDIEKKFIFKTIAFILMLVNIKTMFLYILQATNRIKEYARVTMLDRVVYIVLVISFLLIGIANYKIMILSDIVGKLISFICAVYFCKDIVLNKFGIFCFSFSETFNNIIVGIKLMFSNIASMLIIGIVRFGIERTWDVATFGKVSLTLNISNMTMLFINAIGIIMYPILRRTNKDKLYVIYTTARNLLMIVLLGALLMYYPMKVMLSKWLPHYSESLMFMALIFPIFIYEGKMSLLINTYYKALREEKRMLHFNLISMLLSIILSLISMQILCNLYFAVINIVILYAFRAILSELYLCKKFKMNVKKDIVLELLLTVIFIISSWYIDSWLTVIVYMLAYFIYIIVKNEDIKKMLKNIKLLAED